VSDVLTDKRRKYFTPADVAIYLGISRSYVYRLIDSGDLEACRFGRAVRVSRAEIARFEEQSKYLNQ
jgi:excisionase family DNA binding protein